MFDVLARLGRWLSPKQRRKQKRRSDRARSTTDLMPTLQVRSLEERRVFHAGALVAPQAAANQQPPPPPSTTITLDADNNLLVQDAAAGGKNDQLAVQFDATHGGYVITSASHGLVTEIAGAIGSGTNQVFIPVAEVSGGKLIMATGDGNDSLSVDLSEGLGGKSLVFDGGAGNDAVSLSGGAYGSVDYLFSADGTTQIQAWQGATASLVELRSVEPVQDQLVADFRRFVIGGGIAGATLDSHGIAGSGMAKLTTSLGTSVVFVTPLSQLTLDAGTGGQLSIAGTTNLNGADLTVRAGTLELSGAIVSHHATIDLAATNSLTVTASGVIENTAGVVLLDAGAAGTLQVSGRIDVSTEATGEVGGTVHLLGREVKLLDGAAIDASGSSGGGTVLVGGDYQGLNPLVRRATNTLVSSEASITANALVNGDGGKIIVWADEAAIVAGSGNLQARGGSQGGNGGFIETSGKRYLALGGAADAGSPLGMAGMWLLDPFNVEIVAGNGGTIPGGIFTPAANSQIGVNVLEAALATTNVTIFTGTGGNDADGNITVTANISVALGAGEMRTLTLNAAHNVIVNGNITATSGTLNVALNANSTAGGQADPNTAVGSVTVSGAITTNGGTFVSTGLDFTNTGAIATGSGAVSINHGGNIRLADDITTSGTATIVTSNGGIAFDSAARLTAGSASLTATGGAITADEAGTDIDTSSAGGAITLSSTAGIGTSTRAITVAANAGVVTATAGSADIYLESTTDLTLGVITTGASASTVSITADNSGSLDISIGATSTTNDTWTLTSTGNISLNGAVRLNAGSATLNAGGSISSGTDTVDIDTSNGDGAITLSGDLGIGTDLNRFLVRADDGLVALATDDGNGHIFLSSTGSLDLGAVTTKMGAQDVDIRADSNATDDIAIEVSSTTDDDWTLIAGRSIEFVGAVTVAAASANLTATAGAITADMAATHISTSAEDGAITLTSATGIGSSTRAITVAADDGIVTATTGDADIYVASATDLELGVITTAANANTVSVTANSVAGLDIAIRATSDTDDNWTLTASGNIAFTGTVHVNAGSATLDAGGRITSGDDSVDIDATGVITLTGDLGIGMNANDRFLVDAGGLVTLTTTGATGHIFLASTGSLRLGQVTTGATAQTVNIIANSNTGDDIAIEASSTTDDTWTLLADDSIQFVGDVTVAAGSAALTATNGAITADTAATPHIDTSAADGAITLTSATGIGSSSQAITVAADAGVVKATTGNADIYLASTSNLALGAVITGAGTNTVSITANSAAGLDINIGVTSSTNDDWTLTASGNIAFAGSGRVNATSANLSAGGAITSVTADVVIDTHAANGSITLSGASGIGTAVSAIEVWADDGLVTLTTNSAGGDIYLVSAGQLDLGAVTTASGAQIVNIQANSNAGDDIEIEASSNTDDEWTLVARDTIDFVGAVTLTAASATLTANNGSILGGTADRDIVTSASVSLLANIIGTGGEAVVLQPGTGTVSLEADNGGINALIETLGAGFSTSQLTLLRSLSGGGGSAVSVVVLDGQLTLNSVAGFQSLANDDVTLGTAGTDNDIHIANAVTFDVNTLTDTLTLAASGAITSAGNSAVLTTGGGQELTFTADSIGTQAAPVVVQPGSTISATASGDIYLRRASGTLNTNIFTTLTSTGVGSTVSIGTLAGNVQVNGGLGGVADDTLVVQAAGAGADILFDATVSAGNVTLIAEDAIVSDNTDNADINTSATSGDILLTAGGQIGASGNELRVTADEGLVTVVTTGPAGHIYLLSMGNLELGTVTTAVGSAQTVEIGTTTGNLALTVDNTLDDNVRLHAAGNLVVGDDVTTTALSFTDLRAGGAIISGGTGAIDFATTGAVLLTITGGSVGTQNNPLHVDHEGTYALSATGDLWLLIADGNLLTSDITSVTMPNAGTTLGLITANGSITVASNLSGLVNNALHLEARGAGSNINLDPSLGTLTFAAVTLLAEEGAIKNLSAGLAIDTSAGAGGNITLRSLGAIGADGTPVVVQAGGGQVSATTTGPDGDIYLRSQSQFHLGLIDAEDPGVQTIQLTSDLGINIEVASATEDDWELIALAGNIDFDGIGSLTANSVSLDASGNINFNGSGGIVAGSASLLADGTITSLGSAANDVDTSAAGGTIQLEAGGMGTFANRLTLAPGTGNLDVTVNNGGDAFLLVNANSLAMSQFSVLSFGAAGTFDLALSSGNLTVDAPVLLAGTDVALRTLGAASNIDFTAAGSLTAADVTLVATGAITTAAGAVDITAGGGITLTGNLGIGAAGTPLSVVHGLAGVVTATTTTGNVYLLSPSDLNLGVVTTNGGAQTVDIRSATNLAISGASNTNDNWTLLALGNIQFLTGSVTAGSMSATALFGQLLSGTAGTDVEVTTGAANLVAAGGIGIAGNRFAVVTGNAGLVNASTSNLGAAVHLESSGLIRVGQVTTAAGANTVAIMDQGGNSELQIVGANSTDDNWTLDSGSDLTFVNSGAVSARTFTAVADEDIIGGTAGVDINTVAFGGDIFLDAGGGIGAALNPLSVMADEVSAVGHADDVYLTSPGNLKVIGASAGNSGDPDGEGNVSLVTTGNQSQLTVQVATLDDDHWHLIATGNIRLEVAGAMDWNNVQELRAIGAGRNVLVSTDSGPIHVDTVHSGVATADDNLTLQADAGNIEFSGSALLSAAKITLDAANGSILSTTTAVRVSTGGLLALNADGAAGSIGSAGTAFAFSAPQLQSSAGQEQHLITAAPTRIIDAETTNAGGSISLVQGTFYLANPAPNSASVDTSMLHVEAGAHLGGNGLVDGTLHVLSGGVANMGFGGEQAGLLRVQGDIVFDSGSELIVDINSPYTTPGRDYDHVQVSGNVFLNNSTLTLRGAQDLRTTLNPIVLFDLAPGMITTGGFAVDGISLFQDGTDVRARVGQFRGKLSLFGGPDGNDIILNDLSLVPPVQQTGFVLPPPQIPVFTRSEQPPVLVQSLPPLASSIEAPAIEVETEAVGIRYLEIRIVVPIDEAGNVEEVFALKLPAEWLTNLPAILRRLPDDRYRIYLILEGGSEERLVMDVLVRDGRPVEPNESQALEADAAEPAASDPAAESKILAPVPAEAAPLPALPELPPAGFRDQRTQAVPGAGRFFVGASAAVAAVVASRRQVDSREKEVDDVAEAIGRAPPPTNSRWWRFSQNTTLSR